MTKEHCELYGVSAGKQKRFCADGCSPLCEEQFMKKFVDKQFHVMCYSPSFKDEFISTNIQTLENIFEYVERFFSAPISKVVVVETGKTIENPNMKVPAGMQLDFGF